MTRYTLEAGRSILRDGKRFATIQRSVDTATGAGPSPTDVDDFSRLCAAAPDLLDAARSTEGFLSAAMDEPGTLANNVAAGHVLKWIRAAIAKAEGES